MLVEDGARCCCGPVTPPASRPASPTVTSLVNKSARDAVYLEVGTRAKAERAHYSGIDMQVVRDETGFRYLRNNGEPYV